MKNQKLNSLKTFLITSALLFSTLLFAASKDDPILTTIIIDQLEYSDDDGAPVSKQPAPNPSIGQIISLYL